MNFSMFSNITDLYLQGPGASPLLVVTIKKFLQTLQVSLGGNCPCLRTTGQKPCYSKCGPTTSRSSVSSDSISGSAPWLLESESALSQDLHETCGHMKV